MLLAIDAGNTNTVFAVFDDKKIVAVWRMSTSAPRTPDEYIAFLAPLFARIDLSTDAVTAAILGSVVPEANANLTRLCRDTFRCEALVVGTSSVAHNMRILIDHPEELGADRIINAIAGLDAYKPPFAIIDFGTATTFDLVDENGAYIGGMIAPGINLSLQALHLAAAKLPRVAVARPQKLIGTNTVEAIQSGIFWGYVGLIEGLIIRIRQELKKPITFVSTGGLAPLFTEAIEDIDCYDNNLTLNGLRLLFEQSYRKS